MKITILYVSVSGNTQKAASYIKEGIAQAGAGIEVKLINLLEEEAPDNDFIAESAAVIIGSPTYFADMCWQLKKWFDVDRAYSAGQGLANLHDRLATVGGVVAIESEPGRGTRVTGLVPDGVAHVPLPSA